MRQTEREFLDLPRRIYKGNRNWVCPLDPSIQAVFDPKKERSVRRRRGDFAGSPATIGARWWGRIAAFYDREHAYLEEQPTGGCGFFEAINDQALANQLFDAARMWLASRGLEAMDGPINFGPRSFVVGPAGERIRVPASV